MLPMATVSGVNSRASSISTTTSACAPHCKACKLPRKGQPRSGCHRAPSTPLDHLEGLGVPATAPPRIGPASKLRINAPLGTPALSIAPIPEEPETTDGPVLVPKPLPVGTGKDTTGTNNESRRLAQDLHALLNTNSLSLAKLHDRGPNRWGVIVAGDGGSVEKWVLTMDKDTTCRER
jgi:hypothetical protein